MTRQLTSIIPALIALTACAASATGNDPIDPPASVSLPLSYTGLRPSVPVSVDGTQEPPFIVDTAASMTVIDSGLAGQLQLLAPAGAGTGTVEGASGAVSGVEAAVPDTISLGNITLEKPTILKWSMQPFSKDKPYAGILGNDITGNYAMLFDVPGGELRLESADRIAGMPDEACVSNLLPDRAPTLRNFAIVPVTLTTADGHTATVAGIIDTGAPRSFINPAAIEALAIGDADYAADAETTAGFDHSKSVASRRLTLSGIRIGAWEEPDVEVSASDLPVFAATGLNARPAMILGMNLLDRRAFTLDRHGDAMCVPKPEAS